VITPELRSEIRRLFYAEHWRIGTIASTLGVHADTVRHAIEAQRFLQHAARPRPSRLDPYLDFIRETLERYPKLRSTRLYWMLRDRGYAGSATMVRRLVGRIRPRPVEAFLRLSVLCGEQAQVDWGCFGHIGSGPKKRPLSCFVMVLSWSRGVHALFTLDQTLESFIRGHVEAFRYFGGVPRVVLYDNLKSAVLERRGDAIHFQPRLLELAGHYHYAPRPVSVARGNEKGRVERRIQDIRQSFFAARPFRDVDDLNAQFCRWRDEVAHTRPVPGQPELKVGEALDKERGLLLPLPEHPFEADHVRAVSSGKTPYVRFDRNLYSIPHDLVRKPLALVAGSEWVRILDGSAVVARHRRSYETAAVVEDPAHVAALVREKGAARESRGRDRLRVMVPESDALFDELALRGANLGANTSRLLRLLDDYGAAELRVAVEIAIERGAYGAGSIAHILEQRRRASGQRPPMRVELPADPRVRDLRIIPHRLEPYDALGRHDDKNDKDDNRDPKETGPDKDDNRGANETRAGSDE
jgi:transposase